MNRCTLEELSKKQVVNLCDGRALGCVSDLVFNLCDGKLLAIVVSNGMGLSLKKGKDITVPWDKIQKIGSDTILVDVGELPGDDCCERKGRLFHL